MSAEAPSPTVKLIAAMARNRVIGRGNALPWSLPQDLKRFRRLTLGKAVIMGRRTFDSIGTALPGRENIVVTRDRGFARADVASVASLDEALARVPRGHEAMVIGGGEIYALALPLARFMHLTLVHHEVQGDVYFPDFDCSRWQEVLREEHAGEGGPAYAFVDLRRR